MGHVIRNPSPAQDISFSQQKSSYPLLEPLAMVAMDAGRMVMQAGANGKSVERIVETIARGLGAEHIDLRIGYASLAITVGIGDSSVTRMRKVGGLGVNHRLIQAVWNVGKRVGSHELTTEETRAELAHLATEMPHHSPWVVSLAVGLACAAFGRLLGVDWHSTGSVFLASMIGQFVRREFLSLRMNVFLCTAVISFLSSLLAGLGARWIGSETITIAMTASILLLVPGIPAVNAQSDILEGHPTLGSARAVSVVMTLIFIAAGLWLANVAVNEW
jgi:uncharacterized membrane protein YjjP (DUF1212 family)